MGHLKLALLGPPEVRHGGQVVPFRTRKALALLIYVVVKGGMHSREKLADLFWPASEEEQGRALLRSTLVYVRKTLGEMGTPSHLLIEHGAIGFNVASDFTLDLNALQAVWEGTRASPGASGGQDGQKEAGDDHRLIQFQQAVTLYRGDFLEEFSLPDAPDFDEWCAFERAYWHRQMDAIFERLAQLHWERGEMRDAFEVTTRWITHDPFNEIAYQRLMQVQSAAGDRTAAWQTYETCRAMLAKEFHARPAPETDALAERLRVKDAPRGMLSPPLQERGGVLLAIEPPLIGRGDEHSTLVRTYYTLRTAGPQVVTLVGEAGIGKTRFATEFLRWARVQGADVLAGQAFEAGGRLPYQPLVEALRSRLAHEPAPVDVLPPIWLAELGRLLPELRERAPDLPSPSSDEATAQTRLFESVARLGQTLAKRASLVVFIDDLQWADASSLDLLHYVCRSFVARSAPILLLFSLRSETLAHAPELTDWVASLERDVPVTRMALGPLTSEETAHLFRSLAHVEVTGQVEDPATERFGRWLYAETGGQPFFIMETLKTLLERGLLVVQRAKDGTRAIDVAPAIHQEDVLRGVLPAGVREVIRARLARLPANALSLLVAGSVLGKSFTFAWLCQVARMAEHEGLPALEALLTSRLLTEVGNGKGSAGEERFLFAHDKIRDVVYTEAGNTRRRLFHRQALEMLQAAEAAPAELAHHALAAGLPEAVLRWSIAAGDEAMRLFAVRDAVVHYEQARRLVKRSDEGGQEAAQGSVVIAPSDLSQLYRQLGWAYELSGALAQANSIYEEMLTLARERQDPAMECAALNRLATLAAQRGRAATVEGLLQQALAIAESSQNTADIAETAWNLAQTGFYTGKFSAALLHGERALALARELDLRELIGRSLQVLATTECAMGRWEECLAHAQEGRARYVGLGHRPREAACLGMLATASILAGQPQEGVDLARAALAISREIEDLLGQIHGAVQLELGLLECGVYSEALAVIQQGIALARAHEIPTFMVIVLNEAGNVYREMQALEDAQAAHREALTRCEGTMPSSWLGRIAGELCADCALAGQWQDAYSYAFKAAALRDPLMIYGGLARWHEIEALLRGGNPEQAREEVRRIGEHAHNSRRYRIPYLRAEAALARWGNETDQAIAHLEAALMLAEELDLPGERWQILAALGEMYQSSKNESQARQTFARAAQIVQSLADRMEDGQHRTTFLSAQQVRAVLEHDVMNL
ncbi:MAG TPA: AAA family ATPase [Ktedonobacteraceae bacterium]